MSKPKLILIGAGGHAHACIDVIEQHGQYQIAGLVGMSEEMHTRHFGYSVIATDGDLPQLAKDYQYALITVGQIQTSDHRIRLYQQATELGFQLPVIIAPSAHVSCHATIGSGTIVMHGASYVSEGRNSPQGRSSGCLAMDMSVKDGVITSIKDGALLYAGLGDRQC